MTTSSGVAAGTPAAAAQPSQTSDLRAALARVCARIATTDPEPSLQKAALIAASLELGAIAHLPPDKALAVLVAAARAGSYPTELDGEALPSLIKRWLQSTRRPTRAHDWCDTDRGTSAPTLPAPAGAASPRAAPERPANNAIGNAGNSQANEKSASSDVTHADGDDNSWAHNRGLRQQERSTDAKINTLLERRAQAVPDGSLPPLRVVMVPRAAELAPDRVHWLWERRLALGKLSLIGGAAGTGKSTLAISLIAAVTTGGPWPCGEGRAPRGSAIILSAEDDEHDTIVPRLLAAGADRDRVGILSSVSENGQRRPFNLRADLALLEIALKQLGDVRLVTIDPISSYLGGIDANGNARVRALLQPLAALAARYGVAVVAITHPPKGRSLNPGDHFIGSIAFNAAARASYLVQIDAADQNRRLLVQVKNNLAADRGTLAFRITEREVAPGVTGSAVVFEETRSEVTARELMRLMRDTATADAAAFLRALIRDGTAVKVSDIEYEARLAGLLRADQPISQCKPLREARLALGISVKREGFGPEGRWVWGMEGVSG